MPSADLKKRKKKALNSPPSSVNRRHLLDEKHFFGTADETASKNPTLPMPTKVYYWDRLLYFLPHFLSVTLADLLTNVTQRHTLTWLQHQNVGPFHADLPSIPLQTTVGEGGGKKG